MTDSVSTSRRSFALRSARRRARSDRASGSVGITENVLVLGYLSAVARSLGHRGVLARAIQANPPDADTLGGTLTLQPCRDTGSRWVPARLRWDQHGGWSATLTSAGHERLDGVVRYLPGQLVPAPATVAHFIAALDADTSTIWAAATCRAPRPVDRRWLVLQLSRFAPPDPLVIAAVRTGPGGSRLPGHRDLGTS
ncbi:MAG TPA: DUF6292 family protein [Pseudonocardia sp.]|jgi:hypothetical protein